MNNNMIAEKKCVEYKNPFYIFLFLSSEIVGTGFVTFVDIVFITFVGTLSTAFIISSHTITELLAILFK